MKNLINFAVLTMAAIRSASAGKTLVVSNFVEDGRRAGGDEFTNKYSFYFKQHSDEVTHIINPLNSREIISELNSGLYDAVALQTHGGHQEEIPTMSLYGDKYVPFSEILREINSAENAMLHQIHLSSCYIGININQLFDSQSFYYCELNKYLKNNQLLFLHGDEYQGNSGSYKDRLPHLIANKEYSIIEALIDSGESLNVIFKKDGQLKVFSAKTFIKNGKETVENYRAYLIQLAEKAKNFEVENGILGADVERPDVRNMSDNKIETIMSHAFFTQYSKKTHYGIRKGDFYLSPDRAKDMFEMAFNGDYRINFLEPPMNQFLERSWIFAKESADNGDFKKMRYLLKEGIKIDEEKKQTLIRLINLNPEETANFVNYLENRGADIKFDEKALPFLAVEFASSGNFQIAKQILKKRFSEQNLSESLLKENSELLERKGLFGKTILDCALEEDDKEFVDQLLENGASIDEKYLPFVASKGYLDLVKIMVEKGANIDFRMNRGATALEHAAYKGHLDIIKFLVEKGAKPFSSLNFATEKGYLDIVRYLVEKGADYNGAAYSNSADDEEMTAFLLAVARGHKDIVKYFVEQGADVNSRHFSLYALEYAAKRGDIDVVKYLVEKGANVDSRNFYYKDKRALEHAAYEGHSDVVKYLVEKGASFTVRFRVGGGEMVTANWNDTFSDIFSEQNLQNSSKAKGLFEIAFILEEKKGIKFQLPADFLEKSFGFAVQNRDDKQIEFLLKKGVKIDEQTAEIIINEINSNPKDNAHLAKFLDFDKFGAKLDEKALPFVALKFAGDGNFEKAKDIITKILPADDSPENLRGKKEQFDFLNYQDSQGYSLLMYTAQNGDKEFADFLLKNGASISLTNKEGESAFRIAKKNHHEAIADEIESVHKKTGDNHDPEIFAAATLATDGVAVACVNAAQLKGNNKIKTH